MNGNNQEEEEKKSNLSGKKSTPGQKTIGMLNNPSTRLGTFKG